MNKKILIPILLIIILVVAIVVVKITQDETSKLSKIYNKMVENQTYTFTRYDLEENNKRVTYRKVNKTLIDKYELDAHTSTLIIDGDTYLIVHKDKEYYFYPNNNPDEEILTDQLRKIIDIECTEGKEKIYGRTYKYEEYKGVSDFMISDLGNIDIDSIKTRFYFKGNELVYLKTIYDVVDEETGIKTQKEELQTIEVKYEVEDSVFEIPSDYAEN